VCAAVVLSGFSFAGTATSVNKTSVSAEVKAAPQAANPVITGMVADVDLHKLYTHIYDLQNFTSRDAKSAGAQNAAAYIRNEFAKSAELEVRYDPFDLEGTPVKNVLAVLPGLNKTNHKQYIISGHYDSYSNNPTNKPGADDDATGTVIAMEAARIFSQYRFDATVVFAAWNAEEYGLVGSYNYAKNASAHNLDVGADIQFDMVGNDNNKGDSIYKIDVCAFSEFRWLWTALSGANTDYACGLQLTDAGPSGGSDHVSFNEFGYPSLMCIEGDFSPNYHTANDVIANINPELVTRTAKMGIAALAQMAGVQMPDEGAIFLNKPAYKPDDVAEITVYDSDVTAGTVPATIKSTTETAGESVTLNKVKDGIYTGTIPIKPGAAVPGNGQLEVHHGDVVTAQYQDTSPVKTAVVKSRIDGVAPAVWGIATYPDVNEAKVVWYTDEPANSTLFYGKTAPPIKKAETLPLVTYHSIDLFGLDPGTVYYFDIKSTDIADNTVTMDNGGSHYGFTTLTGIASIPGNTYAYWVRESTSMPGGQNPHFDGEIRTGWGSQSLTTYGAIQFNISALPGGATITNATIRLYAHGWLNAEDSGDSWPMKMLAPAIDSNFPTHAWPAIDGASIESVVPPTYPDSTLAAKTYNYYYYNSPSLISQLNTHILNGKLSVRMQREGGSTNHLFAWDAGYGDGSNGIRYGPRLSILYTTAGDNTGPSVTNLQATPNPTVGKKFVNLTATITDDKSKVVCAEWYFGADPGLGKGIPASGLGYSILDKKIVNVSEQIDVSAYSPGDYTINLRGMDESGNWGSSWNIILHVTSAPVFEPVFVIIPGAAILAAFVIAGHRKTKDTP
jgi:hypothetical protein